MPIQTIVDYYSDYSWWHLLSDGVYRVAIQVAVRLVVRRAGRGSVAAETPQGVPHACKTVARRGGRFRGQHTTDQHAAAASASAPLPRVVRTTGARATPPTGGRGYYWGSVAKDVWDRESFTQVREGNNSSVVFHDWFKLLHTVIECVQMWESVWANHSHTCECRIECSEFEEFSN